MLVCIYGFTFEFMFELNLNLPSYLPRTGTFSLRFFAYGLLSPAGSYKRCEIHGDKYLNSSFFSPGVGVIQKLIFGSCFVSLIENRLALLCEVSYQGQLYNCNCE